MFIVVITRPPFIYTTFSLLLFYSILFLKNCSLLLNVESGRSFLALNFLGFFCLLVFCVLELLLLLPFYSYTTAVATLALARNQGKGVARLRAYK
jgi:hypothetical protein